MVNFSANYFFKVQVIFVISEESDMIDEQKCAQKYLREIQKKTTNTLDARFDNLVERYSNRITKKDIKLIFLCFRLNNYDIKFMELNNNRIEYESINIYLIIILLNFIIFKDYYNELTNQTTQTSKINRSIFKFFGTVLQFLSFFVNLF